jgi:hypothetical protein
MKVVNSKYEGFYKWDIVKYIQSNNNYIFILTTTNLVYIVPKGAFILEREYNEFLDLAKYYLFKNKVKKEIKYKPKSVPEVPVKTKEEPKKTNEGKESKKGSYVCPLCKGETMQIIHKGLLSNKCKSCHQIF